VPQKRQPKPRLTDPERHARFLDMAAKVEASNDPKDFDRAFRKVTAANPKAAPKQRRK
jgi:hypothetical protein